MLNLGLLGQGISHSKSPQMYQYLLGEVNYKLFDLENPPKLTTFWKGLDGLSITAPFKKEYLSEVEITGKKCQSINTIKYQDGKFIGISTDYLALRDIFITDLIKYSKIYIYLLGDGVMAQISKLIFEELGIAFEQFDRKRFGDISKLDLKRDRKEQIIVANSCSRDFYFQGKITENTIFFDYNYSISYPFYQFRDGTDLLVRQARYAISFWLNQF